MDLTVLKNIDLKDMLEKLKNGIFSDKKNLIKLGIGFAAILIFLIGYYVFVSPTVKRQEEQITLMNKNKIEIEKFTNNIVQLKSVIKTLEPDFVVNSKLFHSKKEVEDLYQNISKFALINGLSITNLKKGVSKPVVDSQAQNAGQATNSTSQQNKAITKNPEGQKVLYYKIPVEYEIQGNFLSYLKFRRSLSKSQKVINFDKEEISTTASIPGQIISKGTVSIVGLPSEYK